jgi:tetratricopeptide (TPR) repeat protein
MIDGLYVENMIKEFIMKTKLNLSVILMIVLVSTSYAQSDWNWPEDKATAEEKNVLYTDAMKQGNYKIAANHLHWLLDNAPDLHNSLYINGAKIYEGLAELESDPKRTMEFQDSALMMYDDRIKYFGNEGNVLNRKVFSAYKYYNDNKSKYEELFNMYKRAFELNKGNIANYNLVPYFDVARRYKSAGGNLTDEQIISIYDEINSIMDTKESKGGSAGEKFDSYRETLDKLLTATVDVNCDFVKSNFGPKMKANPSDTELAKKVMKLMMAAECSDDPLYMNAVENIYKAEPNYGLSYLLGIKHIGKEQYDEALKYLQEALELTEENTKKGDVHLKIASIYRVKGQKSSAREHFFKAAEQDPTLREEAYKSVGDLYMTSFENCKKEENPVDDRAIFIAAYEMYKKAGFQQGMANAKAQFPSKEEIFFHSYELGKPVTVGCWINETVPIQSRD